MKRLHIVLAVILSMSMGFAGCMSGANKISTDGSTSMEKVVGSLGEQFTIDNPEYRFTYNPTGSGSGIAAVEQGRCDIGLSSRALKESELEKGLIETVLAYDGIVVVVNTENPVSNLTKEQLAAVYTGEITNWSDVGGADGQIVLIGREAGSGTRDGFEAALLVEGKCNYRQELTSTGDIMTTVSTNPLAVGYISLASLKDSVKAISVDGAAPSEETIVSGDYSLVRPYIIVTSKHRQLSTQAQEFFNYITSSDASQIISNAGAVPIH